MNRELNVGVYHPEWILARHNTDHQIMKKFTQLKDYTNTKVTSVASPTYTWTYNLDRLIHRMTGQKALTLRHGLRKVDCEINVIYHYGQPSQPHLFFKIIEMPTLVTTGFMSDRYMMDKFGQMNNRQKEADQLASTLERADMIHFHTEGGRRRFLHYRPEFESKTIAIPFFLPKLTSFQTIQAEERDEGNRVRVLFVGYEGKRKGLYELIEALDILGKKYLDQHNVEVTIVSKDKPHTRSGFHINWYTRLPHEQIIQLMQSASIFVLIPKRESYGLVLLEAMMARCAIIADNDDTRQEIVADAGVLLPSRTPDEVGRALRKLIEDYPYRERLSNQAYKRASTQFLPSVVAPQYSSCFRAIAKNCKG